MLDIQSSIINIMDATQLIEQIKHLKSELKKQKDIILDQTQKLEYQNGRINKSLNEIIDKKCEIAALKTKCDHLSNQLAKTVVDYENLKARVVDVVEILTGSDAEREKVAKELKMEALVRQRLREDPDWEVDGNAVRRVNVKPGENYTDDLIKIIASVEESLAE